MADAAQPASDIVLDANYVLHFKRIDEIDWPNVTGAASCTIWITPVLLRELEKIKVEHKLAKIRQRAAESINFISKKGREPDPIMLRDGVTLAFIDHEPMIDLPANRLSPGINDDVLIASALELFEELGRLVVIATGDSGLALKLRSRQVRPLDILEDCRLPDAADERDDVIRDLQRKLARSSAREPVLSLRFDDGTKLKTLSAPAHQIRPPKPMEQVERENPPLEFQAPSLPNATSRRSITVYHPPSERQIEQYQAKRNKYFSDYQEFLTQFEVWKQIVQQMWPLSFLLSNSGSGPGSNIDVRLTFSSPVSVWEKYPVSLKPLHGSGGVGNYRTARVYITANTTP